MKSRCLKLIKKKKGVLQLKWSEIFARINVNTTQKKGGPTHRYTSRSTVKVSLVGTASITTHQSWTLSIRGVSIVWHPFPDAFYKTLFSHAVNSRSQVSLITTAAAAWGGGTAWIDDGVSACWRCNSVFDATYPGSCLTGFEPAKHFFCFFFFVCITITQSVDSTSRSTLLVFFLGGNNLLVYSFYEKTPRSSWSINRLS